MRYLLAVVGVWLCSLAARASANEGMYVLHVKYTRAAVDDGKAPKSDSGEIEVLVVPGARFQSKTRIGQYSVQVDGELERQSNNTFTPRHAQVVWIDEATFTRYEMPLAIALTPGKEFTFAEHKFVTPEDNGKETRSDDTWKCELTEWKEQSSVEPTKPKQPQPAR